MFREHLSQVGSQLGKGIQGPPSLLHVYHFSSQTSSAVPGNLFKVTSSWWYC